MPVPHRDFEDTMRVLLISTAMLVAVAACVDQIAVLRSACEGCPPSGGRLWVTVASARQWLADNSLSEPATLFLLGSAIAIAARGLRRRRSH
jgi:hypothetical protein